MRSPAEGEKGGVVFFFLSKGGGKKKDPVLILERTGNRSRKGKTGAITPIPGGRFLPVLHFQEEGKRVPAIFCQRFTRGGKSCSAFHGEKVLFFLALCVRGRRFQGKEETGLFALREGKGFLLLLLLGGEELLLTNAEGKGEEIAHQSC